jgi:hypothetical protein
MNLKECIAYHKANPQIYAMFVRFTNEAIRSKRPRYSSKMIVERIRWETMIKADEGYKITNDMTAFYSRLWMLENPTKQLFKTKRSALDGLKLKHL